MALPFGLSVVSLSATAPFVDSSLVRLILSTAATYSFVTVNAYNIWALFEVGGASLATNGAWIPDAPIPDAVAWASIGPVPAVVVGSTLLLAVMLGASVLVARRPDRLTILVGACVLALAFFGVPTRVHERYLFPLFGMAAILLAFSWRWRIAYVVAAWRPSSTCTWCSPRCTRTTRRVGLAGIGPATARGPAWRSSRATRGCCWGPRPSGPAHGDARRQVPSRPSAPHRGRPRAGRRHPLAAATPPSGRRASDRVGRGSRPHGGVSRSRHPARSRPDGHRWAPLAPWFTGRRCPSWPDRLAPRPPAETPVRPTGRPGSRARGADGSTARPFPCW